MNIGTIRPEEAATKDSRAGFHSFEDQPDGSFQVWWSDGIDDLEAGWWWACCFPGCLPDSDPCGPFASSIDAYYDATETS